MAYVITSSCTKDALCIDACPTDCIHPRKDEPQFEAVPQLYVDYDNCIDCGACVGVCPTNSIFVKEELPEELAQFIEENTKYYTTNA